MTHPKPRQGSRRLSVSLPFRTDRTNDIRVMSDLGRMGESCCPSGTGKYLMTRWIDLYKAAVINTVAIWIK